MTWGTFRESSLYKTIEFLFAGLGLILSIFFLWAYWNDRPSREISYFHFEFPVIGLENLGSNLLTLNGEKVEDGKLLVNYLFIWNSGNQNLTANDIGEPLQVYFGTWLPGPPPEKFDISYVNLSPSQMEGDLLTGFRFTSLYPDAGIL